MKNIAIETPLNQGRLVQHGLVYTHPVLPPNVLEAPAGKEEDLYEDVEQEEDGADDVQVEHGLVLLVLPQKDTVPK